MSERAGRARVLVVDDDDALADALRQLLRDAGYSVATVRHGAAALELTHHIEPDLILLDLSMPIMDGWSFARQYRKSAQAHARIVLLTGNAQAPAIARDLGADAYLTKPFENEHLLAVVATHAAAAIDRATRAPGLGEVRSPVVGALDTALGRPDQGERPAH